MHARSLAAVAIILAVPLAAAAQPATRPAGGDAATQPATAAITRPARFEGLTLDVKAGRVIIDAKVVLQAGALEFLLCRGEAKAHESILSTDARPSDVHAALLALGLTPGKPAQWSAPSELHEPVFLPPRGPKVRVSLRWTDTDGQARSGAASEWLESTGENGAEAPDEWVFIGSQIMPDGRYWANIEGEVISVANFASSVLDVPFESSDKNAMLEFVARTKAIPKRGTEVKVILDPVQGAETAAHASVSLDVDRFGRYFIDGRPIEPQRLSEWARGYLARHEEGQVVIRPAARSLTYDVERARQELRFGGVRDIETRPLAPDSEILPRTPAQARQSLEWWAAQFADARDLLGDPGADAQVVLRQIEAQRRQLDALDALWGEYAQQLRDRLDQYRATTQPAADAE